MIENLFNQTMGKLLFGNYLKNNFYNNDLKLKTKNIIFTAESTSRSVFTPKKLRQFSSYENLRPSLFDIKLNFNLYNISQLFCAHSK